MSTATIIHTEKNIKTIVINNSFLQFKNGDLTDFQIEEKDIEGIRESLQAINISSLLIENKTIDKIRTKEDSYLLFRLELPIWINNYQQLVDSNTVLTFIQILGRFYEVDLNIEERVSLYNYHCSNEMIIQAQFQRISFACAKELIELAKNYVTVVTNFNKNLTDTKNFEYIINMFNYNCMVSFYLDMNFMQAHTGNCIVAAMKNHSLNTEIEYRNKINLITDNNSITLEYNSCGNTYCSITFFADGTFEYKLTRGKTNGGPFNIWDHIRDIHVTYNKNGWSVSNGSGEKYEKVFFQIDRLNWGLFETNGLRVLTIPDDSNWQSDTILY